MDLDNFPLRRAPSAVTSNPKSLIGIIGTLRALAAAAAAAAAGSGVTDARSEVFAIGLKPGVAIPGYCRTSGDLDGCQGDLGGDCAAAAAPDIIGARDISEIRPNDEARCSTETL